MFSCRKLLYLSELLCLFPVLSSLAIAEIAVHPQDATGSGQAVTASLTSGNEAEEAPSAPNPVFLASSQNIRIPRLETAPILSDFLAAPVQKTAAGMLRIDKFIERSPVDGRAATESTVAYVGYTHEYLFVAFVCEENEGGLLRTHMMPRDALADDDNVEVLLDTFHDQRRAFSFKSNPYGIQADALFSEASGYDESFDTVWDTWAKHTDAGYVILMRIPFSSLYFAQADPGQYRTWGLILARDISHNSQNLYWPRVTRSVAGTLTQDMPVDGFRDVALGKNRQVQPYAITRSLHTLNAVNPVYPYFQSKHLQGYTGLDSKFIIHNSLVLDTTFNPDFSQVGVNNPAAPNQRFPVFFPEVRPFFIENSSYFMTPMNLYYTDKIQEPQWGARLTGKLGKWAMGVLAVDDRSPGDAVPPGQPGAGTRAYFFTGRLNRDVGTHSNFGLVYADREYQDSFNRAGGIDYRAQLKGHWTFQGQVVTTNTKNLSNSTRGEAKCETQALTCSGQAYQDSIAYTDLHRNLRLEYQDTSGGYVSDTGFFERPDVRRPNGNIGYTFRPKTGPLLSNEYNLDFERVWDHNGVPLDFYLNPSINFNFKARTALVVKFNMYQDRLRPLDYSALTKNVEYHTQDLWINFRTSPIAFLSTGIRFDKGTAINYDPPSGTAPSPVSITSGRVNVDLKPSHYFDLRNSYTFTRFGNISNGALVYDRHEAISRWNFQMTKSISFNFIGQYLATLPNAKYTSLTSSKNLFVDALLTYMPHPGTAFYFGYISNFANIDHGLCTRLGTGLCDTNYPVLAPTGPSLLNDAKTIYVKLSYLLRF